MRIDIMLILVEIKVVYLFWLLEILENVKEKYSF